MSRKFTTKDMVLVNLLEFFPLQDKSVKPLEITQEGLAQVTGSRQNTISYAVRDLLEEGLIYEDTIRVKGRRQRRKGYYLTERGIERSKDIRDRMANTPVKIIHNEEDKEVLIKDVNNYFHTNYTFLEIISHIKKGVFKSEISEKKKSNSSYLLYMPSSPTFKPKGIEDILKWWEGKGKVFMVEGKGGSGKTSLITKFIEKIRTKSNIIYFKIKKWHTERYFWMSLGRFLSSAGEHKLLAYLEATDRIFFKEAMSALRKDLELIDNIIIAVEDIDSQEVIRELVCNLSNDLKDIPSVRLVISGEPDSCPPEYIDKMNVHKLSLEYGDCELPLFVRLGETYGLNEGCDVVLDVIIESKFTPEEFIALSYASIFRIPLDKAEVMMVGEMNKNLFENLLDTPLIFSTLEEDISPHEIVRERMLGRLINEEQKLLHSLATEYFDSIPAKTVEEQIEHLYHAGRCEEPDDFILILNEYANNIISSGYNEQLIFELDSLYIKFDTSGSGGYVELWKAEAYRTSDHLDKALNAYREILDKNSDTEILTRAHIGIASVLKEKNNLKDAIEQYESALDKAKEMGKKGESLLGNIYLRAGETLLIKGEYQLARDFMDKALVNLMSQNDYSLLTTCYFLMASLERDRGNTKEAIKLLEKGIDAWRKINESYKRADGLHDIGSFYKGVRDLIDAEEILEDAVETCEQFGYTHLKASALVTLTECSLERGDSEKAIRTGSEAMEIFQYLDREEEQAYAHALLGQAYVNIEEIEKAENHFNRAITIYHKLGLSYPLGLAYFSLAKLQEKKGNKEGVADNYRKSVLSLMSSGADDMAQQVERVMKTIPISM